MRWQYESRNNKQVLLADKFLSTILKLNIFVAFHLATKWFNLTRRMKCTGCYMSRYFLRLCSPPA